MLRYYIESSRGEGPVGNYYFGSTYGILVYNGEEKILQWWGRGPQRDYIELFYEGVSRIIEDFTDRKDELHIDSTYIVTTLTYAFDRAIPRYDREIRRSRKKSKTTDLLLQLETLKIHHSQPSGVDVQRCEAAKLLAKSTRDRPFTGASYPNETDETNADAGGGS